MYYVNKCNDITINNVKGLLNLTCAQLLNKKIRIYIILISCLSEIKGKIKVASDMVPNFLCSLQCIANNSSRILYNAF